MSSDRRRRRLGALALLATALFGARASAEPPPKAPSSLGSLVVRAGTEAAVYADSDHVAVATPTVQASVESPLSGWAVAGRYLVDVVSAASSDIVATASPRWTEVRHVVSGHASYKPGDLGGDVSASASIEPDYVSITGGATGSLDLLQRNVTLLVGYGFGHDTIGRRRTPFRVFSRTLARHVLNVGVTAVASRATLITAVADAMIERGDPSKPYRYIPMFRPGAGPSIPSGASFDVVNRARVDDRPLERLPLARDRFALTGRLAHRFRASTLRLEERLYVDTWGLKGSTSDLQVIFDVGRRVSLWPHLRVHVQSGADFWRRAYELVPAAGGALSAPEIRAGDRELGPLRSFTGGGGAEVDLSARAGARAWVLRVQADAVATHYVDALYLTRRNALFTAVALDVTLD
jgi:hypothetical protein